MKRLVSTLAAALGAAVLPATQPGTATLTVSGYTGTSTLTDFPVLVRVPYTISRQCGDGSAMRFHATDGVTELAHEIDTWNSGFGQDSYVWVKLPALAAGTTFKMSYGGECGARTTTDADVWTGYVGVWHLNETANDTTTVADATTNELSGTTVGTSKSVAEGKIGRARYITSNEENAVENPYDSGITVDMTDDADKLDAVNGVVPEFTASFWIRPQRNAPRWWYLISRRGADAGPGWGLQQGSDSNWKSFRAYGGEENDSGMLSFNASKGLASNKWTKVDAIWFEDKTFHLYMDGAKVGEGKLANQAGNDENKPKLAIGGSLAPSSGKSGRGVKGDMDEVRLRKGALTPDWIKAEYDIVNNAAFVAFDSVPALDYYVVPAGTAGNAPAAPYDSWATAANDFATLSDALLATSAYPVFIHVAPGTYAVSNSLPLAIPGMTLVSDDGTGATARETTILDGGYPSRTNRIATVSAANVTIRGITFRNSMVAGENDGGAIYADSASDRTSVIDCSFTNCIARHGGAIRFNAANVWLEGCDFTDCHAWTTTTSYGAREGGGVYVKTATGSIITNCSFTACTAYKGGAVKTPAPSIETGFSERAAYTIISGCTFTRNAPVRQNDDGNPIGGGICGRAWVENCRFDANYTPDGSCFNPAIGFDYHTVITNCVFENHSSANRGIVGQFKGGYYETRVVDCVFRGNTCANMLGCHWLTVDRCVFTNNAATGGLFWLYGTNHVVRNSLYAYNWRPLGVGGQLAKGPERYENCTIVSNTCGVYFPYGADRAPIFINCYIGGNTNPPTRLTNYRGNANFGYFETGWDNTTSSFVSDFHATNCVIEGAHILEQRDTRKTFDLFDYEPSGTCEAITDLVAAKGAGFVDAANGDWRLQRKSPLRDAGALLPWMADGATDLDGNPRLTDRFGKPFALGALPDIGCYECQIQTPHGTTLMLH